MREMYLVRGHTGEYDSAEQWDYGVFEDRAHATDCARTLNDMLMVYKLHEKNIKAIGRYDREEAFEKLDPQFSCYYCGAYYDVKAVTVRTETPNTADMPTLQELEPTPEQKFQRLLASHEFAHQSGKSFTMLEVLKHIKEYGGTIVFDEIDAENDIGLGADGKTTIMPKWNKRDL